MAGRKININDMLGLTETARIPTVATVDERFSTSEETSEEYMTVARIIKEKPSVQVVRDFLEDNIAEIRDEDEEGF